MALEIRATIKKVTGGFQIRVANLDDSGEPMLDTVKEGVATSFKQAQTRTRALFKDVMAEATDTQTEEA